MSQPRFQSVTLPGAIASIVNKDPTSYSKAFKPLSNWMKDKAAADEIASLDTYNNAVNKFKLENEGITERDLYNRMAGMEGFSQDVRTKGKAGIADRYKLTGAEAAAAAAEVAKTELLGDYQSKAGIQMLKNTARNTQIANLIAGRASEGNKNRAAGKFDSKTKAKGHSDPFSKGMDIDTDVSITNDTVDPVALNAMFNNVVNKYNLAPDDAKDYSNFLLQQGAEQWGTPTYSPSIMEEAFKKYSNN